MFSKIMKLAIVGTMFLELVGTAQAVQLVTLAGKPVGGHWQRWANEMRVPTVQRLELDVSATDAINVCGTAGGCSMGWQTGQARFTVVAPDTDRQTFYYELGHQFDWRYLTTTDHEFLAKEWSARTARWLDSSVSVAHGAEDGLEAVFPLVYADCATGINDKGQDIAVGFYNSQYAPPGVTPRINTCEYLIRIGLHHHASMGHWKRWNYTPAAQTPIPTTIVGG